MITMVKGMSQHLGGSQSTFPPHLLVPLLEKYAVENQAGVGPRTWLPDLFMEVNFPFDATIAALQGMWFGNLAPFTGKNRKILVDHILYLLDQWMEVCVIGNKPLFGGEDNCRGVLELVEGFLESGEVDGEERKAADILRKRLVRATMGR